MTRPQADTMLPLFVDHLSHALTSAARARANEVRCPERHLLGAVIPTMHGNWLYWRGHPAGKGWLCAWLDDVPDAAELRVWCSACNSDLWLLDVSDAANPTRMPYPDSI
jgi:hypothetical protein